MLFIEIYNLDGTVEEMVVHNTENNKYYFSKIILMLRKRKKEGFKKARIIQLFSKSDGYNIESEYRCIYSIDNEKETFHSLDFHQIMELICWLDKPNKISFIEKLKKFGYEMKLLEDIILKYIELS